MRMFTYETWQNNLGHFSADRYIMLSSTVPDVPKFSSELTKDHVREPYLTAKIEKAPINPLPKSLKLTTSIHVYISGPRKPLGPGENRFAIHLLEDCFRILDVFTVIYKSNLSSHVKWFTFKVNIQYALEEKSVVYLWAGNVGWSLAAKLSDFYKHTGIEIKTIPGNAP